jgi:outer membrane lipoprotein LolB
MRRAARFRDTVLLLLILSSPGCAAFTRAVSPGRAAWDEHRASLEQLDRWSLQARVASGLVGWSGNMHWRQDAEKFDIRVSGPLGAGAFQARGTLDRVEIRTAKETIVTHEPEALIEKTLGWHFPIKHLRYWALGLPEPGLPSELKFDRAGRLQQLTQDGWVLEYSDYAQFGERELPRRFTLESGAHRIRVVVDGWSDVG